MNIVKNLGTVAVVIFSAVMIVFEYYVIKHFGFSYRNIVKFVLWGGMIVWVLHLDKKILPENQYRHLFLPVLLTALLLIAVFTGGLFTKFPV